MAAAVREMLLWLVMAFALLLTAAIMGNSEGCSGPWSCTLEMLRDRAYYVRCTISLPIACLLYLAFGTFASTQFPRSISERGCRPPVYSLYRWDSDFNWSLIGIIAGTPMISLFHHASDKYGSASGMLLYKDPLQYGWIWAFAQVPVYLFIWDFTFYAVHRWVLHNHVLYKWVHSGHHAFRPPTAWAGIAVGPIDVIFEGIIPYVLPLYCGMPFHEYTVNAINAVLTLHALVLHSSCHGQYGDMSGVLGWLMISPIGHNMHHQYGEVNACNFAPIFKLWDRALGTLNESEPFWWEGDRKAARAVALSAGKKEETCSKGL